MKISIIFLFIIVHSYSSLSQSFNSFGIKIGINSSDNSYSSELTSRKNGLSVGLFTELKAADKLYIQPEILFINKGNIVLYQKNDLNMEEVKTQLNFLTIPFSIKYCLSNNKIVPFISLGPRIDILLNCDENGLKGYYSSINSVNYGFTAAVGSQYLFNKNKKIVLELRYSPDLSSYEIYGYEKNNVNIFNQGSVNHFNNSFELLLGIGL